MSYLANVAGVLHMGSGARRISVESIERVGDTEARSGDIQTPYKVTFRSPEIARPLVMFVMWSDLGYEWIETSASIEPRFPFELEDEAIACLKLVDYDLQPIAGSSSDRPDDER